MRKRAVGLAALLVCALPGAFAASAAAIPPDLAARADQLRADASPQVLAWVGDQARALAKGRGPVDVAALQVSVRSRFGTQQPAPDKSSAQGTMTRYPNLGSMGDADIMAMAFIVLMEAAKSAQEDLKAIMARTKAINAAKAGQRKVMQASQPAAAASAATPTPTPAPDRVAQLVAEARKLAGRTQGARLSRVVPRREAP